MSEPIIIAKNAHIFVNLLPGGIGVGLGWILHLGVPRRYCDGDHCRFLAGISHAGASSVLATAQAHPVLLRTHRHCRHRQRQHGYLWNNFHRD